MSSKRAIHLVLGLAFLGASGCVIGPKPDDPAQPDSGIPGPGGDAAIPEDTAIGLFVDAASDAGGGVPDTSGADTGSADTAAADGDAAADVTDATGDSDATDATDATEAGDATVAGDGG